jgi:hypothetical protein
VSQRINAVERRTGSRPLALPEIAAVGELVRSGELLDIVGATWHV